MPKARNPRSGFTLLEMVIALGIFGVVVAGILVVFVTNHSTYASAGGRLTVQDNARVAMHDLVRYLRMAGYFPENFTLPPPPVPQTNPIQVATEKALAILGDADGSGTSNVFLFCLDGTVLRRQKAPAGTAAAYTCGAGEILAEGITSLRFAYFDGNGTPIPSPPGSTYALDGVGIGAVPTFTSTAERGAVRRVAITVTAREDVAGQGPQMYTLTSTLQLRNAN